MKNEARKDIHERVKIVRGYKGVLLGAPYCLFLDSLLKSLEYLIVTVAFTIWGTVVWNIGAKGWDSDARVFFLEIDIHFVRLFPPCLLKGK